MLYGSVQRRRVPALEGLQEGGCRVRALPETNAAVRRLRRRALSRGDRILARTEAQGRRHRDRGYDLGQIAGAGGRLQAYRRTRSGVIATIKESNMTRQMALVGFLQAQNC